MVLRGYSGYNTRWGLKVIEKVFPEVSRGGGAPLAVTVFFGANDACLPDRCSAFLHVPIHEYKQNLRSIVSFLKVTSPLLSSYKHINSSLVRPSSPFTHSLSLSHVTIKGLAVKLCFSPYPFNSVVFNFMKILNNNKKG